ncbi:NAD-dependent epimerase/dehydratase family protein [Chloroflexota bacterium]
MLEEFRRVLVTGGTGFIGSHLAATLLSLGKEVVVFDNLSTGLEGNLPQRAKLIIGDVRNPEQVTQATEDADLIFHVAANASGTVSVNNPRLDFESNVCGTFNVLDAALQTRVKKFIYVSSASVYGAPQRFPIREEHPTNPFVPYGASKLAGEICCRSFFHSYKLPVVIGRPFCVYGLGENPESALVEVSRYLRWHLNGKPIRIIGDIDRKTRDFVHVSDIVQSLLLIADHAAEGEVFNLGSGTEVTMRELVNVIGSVTGQQPIIETIADITEDTYRLVSDISKIRSLGYVPKVSLAEGLSRLAEELGQHPQMPAGATIFKRGQHGEM